MSLSPQQQIESILRGIEETRGSAGPYLEANALATCHPEAVSDLALAVIHRFPKGGTFLDGALSFMPQEKWPELVAIALGTLELSGKNDAADSVMNYASFQCPSALHAHLDRVFLLRPNAQSYYEGYPWKESGDTHFAFLRDVIEKTSSTEGDRERAWSDLFQTRHMKSIEFAISCAEIDFPSNWSREDWVQANLRLVGFDGAHQSMRRLCLDSLYHLQFPQTFFEPESRPDWLARIHPTWNLPASIQPVSFGGGSEGDCALCGEKLHRLFALDPILAGLGINGLKRVEFATCLSCLGWECQQLYYRHDEKGSPLNVGYDGPSITPQFPSGPLKAAELSLAKTPRRWFWQDWGCSNSRENLNRIGGEPTWIQNAQYPTCPSCKTLMPFLFQLDSDLPMANGGELLWGSGGIAYGFWCDDCKISGLLWQCT